METRLRFRRSASVRRSAAIAVVAVSAILVGAPWAAAQPSTATVTGSVLAKDGTGLPGSLVVMTSVATGRAVEVVAGERGVFRAAGLAAGAYTPSARAQGFAPHTLANLEVAPGEARHVTFRLEVATVEDAVTVIGHAPRESVEASEIRQSSARDVGEAIASTPGVWKLRKGGIANEIVVRGYQSKDLNILIDGQRIYGACPSHMDPPAFHADFAEVDRVEVGKGPFDVKNQGSLGGVVNIVTKNPGPGWQETFNAAAGSAGYLNPSATVSYGEAAYSVLAGYSFRSADAYTDGSGRRFTQLANYKPGAVDASAFRVGTAWGKVAYVPSAGSTLEVAYTHQEADHVYYPALMMDGVWDRTDRVNVSYDLAPRGGVALKAQAYFTKVEHWMTDQYRTSAGMSAAGYSMGTLADSRVAGGKVEAGLGEVTAGVEVFQRFWDTLGRSAMSGFVPTHALPGPTTTVEGLYAEWRHPLSATVSVDAGARFDHARTEADPSEVDTSLFFAYNNTRSTSQTDAFPSGYVRLSYRPSVSLEIAGGVGSTVRLPEGSERYYSVRRMGTDWVGNPDLDPSRNTGVDVSASYRWSGFYLSASAFADRVADYIAVHPQSRVNMVPGVMNTSARSYANVDARLIGGELSAVATLTDRLYLSGDLSYVRGTQDAAPQRQITSTNLEEMPPMRGRTALRYDTPRYWVEAEGIFSAAQTHVDASLSEAPTPGWGIANLKAGFTVAGFKVTSGIANLFNRFYYETLSYQRDPYRSGLKVPEPGRNLFVNAGVQF